MHLIFGHENKFAKDSLKKKFTLDGIRHANFIKSISHSIVLARPYCDTNGSKLLTRLFWWFKEKPSKAIRHKRVT